MSSPAAVRQLVTIGSSAGGIEALSALVERIPAAFPAPIVVAQHLDPTRPSHLQEILARRCPLPVRTVTDQEELAPATIYVVPANQHISISDHHLSIDPDGDDRPKPSIDLLFRTAADVFGEGLIAVVLSGLGSDGATGARHVKEQGGTVVIQDPRTASYPSMPQSVAPTIVDVVADAAAIGPLLQQLLNGTTAFSSPRESRDLRAFLADLREQSGIDFAQYKTPTIYRRLQRRFIATGTHSLERYRVYLTQHPEEQDHLINAFLIKVTEFFRDAALFDYLRERIVPSLIERGRTQGKTLRLWSAGCATGEEAYSLAILVADALGDELPDWSVRLFATDLDKEAIAFARRGSYPSAVVAAVPEALRTRYLIAEDGTYAVSKPVRSLLVFGEHDMGQRPPFPHIDLCLCRNVLIYFTPELQRRALEAFAFALRDGGFLALGKAETTNPLPGYFAPENTGLRVYRRIGDRVSLPRDNTRFSGAYTRSNHGVPSSSAAQELGRVRRAAQQAQQEQLAAEELFQRLPVGLAVVDRRYDLQRLNTVARRLLGIYRSALGEDLLHLVRGVPVAELRAAIDAALGGESRTLEDVPTDAVTPGEIRYLQITSQPHRMEGAEAMALLLIADVTESAQARAELARLRALEQGEMVRLQNQERAELERLRGLVEQLTTLNRELLAANEELATNDAMLRRSNEEYVVGNEEIQAATEEVETLNEELQATNEELETLNEEQQATVEELETTNEELRARGEEARALAATVEEQRRRLTAILDSMGDAVVVLHRSGDAIFTNALFDQMVGSVDAFVAEDAEGRPLAPEATPQARLFSGEAFRMEFTLQGTEGQRRWIEATGRPIGAVPAEEGVLVLRDITDRTVRRLQEEFLALASHELRTPLTAIKGYVDLIDRGLTSGKEVTRLKEQAAEARAQIARLTALVGDLLDVGRLSDGMLHLRRIPLELTPLVVRATETARILAPERVITLDVPDELLSVSGDGARLEQVLLNLLTNALHYAPESPIDVRLRRDAGEATIDVVDKGPGIPPEALPHLFTRFFQIASRDRSSQSGLGLGLYIAKSIVAAHGGSIRVRSTLGEGSTFTVRLPLSAGPAPEQQQSP